LTIWELDFIFFLDNSDNSKLVFPAAIAMAVLAVSQSSPNLNVLGTVIIRYVFNYKNIDYI
jgi:hypothetical protein